MSRRTRSRRVTIWTNLWDYWRYPDRRGWMARRFVCDRIAGHEWEVVAKDGNGWVRKYCPRCDTTSASIQLGDIGPGESVSVPLPESMQS